MLKRGLLIIVLLITSMNVKAQSEITGVWQLNSYGYSNASGMSFSFIKGVKYEFRNDKTGFLIKDMDTINFVWKQKKMNLTISFSDIVYQYRIVEISTDKLMIVDKNAGKDENRTYVAYEKGLLFDKKNK